MNALPGQLFYSTQIPVCLWFLAKNKHDGSVVVNESTLAIMNLALRGIEADREMPSGELRFPNGTSVTSTFALRPSNFAPASPGQLFYSTQKFNHN